MSTPSDQLDVRLAAILAKLKSRSADLERGRRWPLPPEDPDLRKHLARLCDALGDLLRLQRIGGLQPEDEPRLHELLHAFEQLPDSEMTRDDAWMALYETQLFLIDTGDADVVCGMVGSELRWHQTDTSWLTWNAYFGSAVLPEVVERYRKGERVSRPELAACRNRLQELVRARHYDEEAHRSRAEQRSRNLAVLAAGLLALIPLFLTVLYLAQEPRPSLWTLPMIPLAGALGAALSGTLKARDQLTRKADILRFLDALPAQLLVGAVAAIIVVVLLEAQVVEIGKITVTSGAVFAQAAFAFVAGFSEPFALGTIERAAKLGSSKDDSGNGTSVSKDGA